MFDLEKVKDLLKTEPNTAYFWSGLGEKGAEIAEQLAKENDGTTLEMIMKKYKQELINAEFPYDSEFDRFIWDDSDPLLQRANTLTIEFSIIFIVSVDLSGQLKK